MYENTIIAILSSTFLLATPLYVTGLGESFGQRSGLINLGLEGIMLIGAFIGFFVSYATGNALLGVLSAVCFGILMGIVMSFMTVILGSNQSVTGLMFSLFGSGLSSFLMQVALGIVAIPPPVEGFPLFSIPVLSEIPFVGPILFKGNILFYFSFILIPIFAFILHRTKYGLRIKAVGENPKAADSVGINVFQIRFFCGILSCAMAAFGGAYISLAQVFMFMPNLTAGTGFVALSIVILGRWDPIKIFLGSLVFSALSAIGMNLQAIGVGIPYHFLLMLPFIATILVLIVGGRRAEAPKSIGQPYSRE